MRHWHILFVLGILSTATAYSQEWSLSIPQRAVYSVASNPLNRSTVIAGNFGRLFFLSQDGGASWQELSVGDPGGTSRMSTLLFHPADTNILFAGGIGFTGLDRSTDQGQTWENVLKDPIGTRFEVASNGAVAFHPLNSDTMYVLRSSPAIVFRSIDRGETWDSLGTVLALGPTGRMRALAVSPDSTNIMLATGRSAIIHRSVDGGRTWASTGYYLSAQPDADGAQIRWSPTKPGTVYATCQYSLVQNTGNGGLHVSEDYGVNWMPMRFVDTSLYALEVFPTKNGDEIFVGGSQIANTSPSLPGDSTIYRSVDGGVTWQNLSKVSWYQNELEDTVANVWGFATTYTGSAWEVLMASEVGAYRSSSITSVNEFQHHIGKLTVSYHGGSAQFNIPEGVNRASMSVSTILGQMIHRQEIVGDGMQSVRFAVQGITPFLIHILAGNSAGTLLVVP